MAVTRDYTPQDFLGSTAPVQGTSAAPTTQGGTGEGGNVLLQGEIARTGAVVGRSATVKAGEDIRPALESLRTAGGGTLVLLAGIHKPTYDIVGSSKINIIGEGVDQTIIDFGGGAFGIKYEGSASNIISNFNLSNFTVTNSTASAGLDIDHADNFVVDFVAVKECVYGFYLGFSQFFLFSNCLASANSSDGFFIDADQFERESKFGEFRSCNADNNGANGFNFSNSGFSKLLLYNATAVSNTLSGFSFFYFLFCTAIFCQAELNGGYGFECGGSKSNFSHCISGNNTDHQFYVTAYECVFLSCRVGTSSSVARGFVVEPAGINTDRKNVFIASDATIMTYGRGAEFIGGLNKTMLTDRTVLVMENNSGVALSVGYVVVYDSTPSFPATMGKDIALTTTVGDDKVLGVVEESTSDGLSVEVVTTGEVELLKVNGVIDIAVGDFLCTYSTGGISQKASAGDMAFAIAKEAYTTDDSNGEISAILISPRKI